MTYVEQEHPRWPAGSPGGRGGEWRPRSGGAAGWAGAALERMGFSPRDELLDTLRNGIMVDQVGLAGGESADTRITHFEMPDGSIRKLVRKRHETKGTAHTAANTSLIAEAVGAPVPPEVIDTNNPRVTWMPLVDGRSVMEVLATSYHGGQMTWAEIYDENEELYFEAIKSDAYRFGLAGILDLVVNTDEGRLLGLFDMLVQYHDRHEGNWLISDHGITGIDHTEVDTATVVTDERIYWTDSPFARHFMWGDRVPEEGYGAVAVDGLADNDMHPDDLSLIARRIAALYDDGGPLEGGARHGSPMNEEAIMSRLRSIAAHARGTRRRLS